MPKLFARPEKPAARPLLIRVIPWLAMLQVVLVVPVVLLGIARLLPPKGTSLAMGDGWLQFGIETKGVPWAPLTLVAPLSLILVAYSFWSERPWSRHVVAAGVVVSIISDLLTKPQEFVSSTLFILVDTHIPNALVTSTLLLWYFYFKPNVRAYYARLERERGGTIASPPPPAEDPSRLEIA